MWERKKTQEWLGNQLGITAAAAGRMYQKKSIHVGRLLKLCEVFDVPITYFIPNELLRIDEAARDPDLLHQIECLKKENLELYRKLMADSSK